MGGYFYIFSDLLCKKFSLSNISDLFLHFSRFVLWTSFSHIYILDGKEVASFSANLTAALYFPQMSWWPLWLRGWQGIRWRCLWWWWYGFGRPPKTDRTAIAQSREGEDDGLLGPQYIQPRLPYSYPAHKSFSVTILGEIRVISHLNNCW